MDKLASQEGAFHVRRVADAETMPSTTPASPSAAQLQFESLTSLRFVAAMSVVIYHYFSLSTFSSPGTVSATTLDPVSRGLGTYVFALSNGHLAVGFFFMLSGFVLAHAHFQQLVDRSFDYVRFLKRRFSRIYPLHFLVTLGYGGLFLVARGLGITVNNAENFTWAAFLSNIFLVRGLNLIGHLTFNGPAWFVSSQWHLYLLFPMLAYFVLRSPLKSGGTLCVAVAFFLGLYYFVPGDELLTQRTHDFGILRDRRVSRGAGHVSSVSRLPALWGDLHSSAACSGRGNRGLRGRAIRPGRFGYRPASGGTDFHSSGCGIAPFDEEAHQPVARLWRQDLLRDLLDSRPLPRMARKAFPLLGASRGSLAEGVLLVVCVALLLPTSASVYRWIEIPANKSTQNLLSGSPRPTLAAA